MAKNLTLLNALALSNHDCMIEETNYIGHCCKICNLGVMLVTMVEIKNDYNVLEALVFQQPAVAVPADAAGHWR